MNQATFAIRWYILAELVLYGFVTAQRCGGEVSIYGMMLKRHKFHKIKTQNGFECLQTCNAHVRCQSFNYVMTKNLCELNNRTKEARPVDFVPNSERYYMRRDRERVPLGSIPALPAESCKEIKSSEGSQAVSGKYWFDSILPGKVVHAHCDMHTEDIDECTADPAPCDVNGNCTNSVGSYICFCNAGFISNRKNCTIDRGFTESSILSSLNGNSYREKLELFLEPVLTDSAHSRFVRCYHANTDGWAVTTFHSKCDGRGPSVTIIKVDNYIFGGYTSLAWHGSCAYSADNKAFIFSLFNTGGYNPVKLNQYQQLFAMYSCSFYGPTFGGGHDIYVGNNANAHTGSHTNLGHSYQAPPGCSTGVTSCSRSFLTGNNKFRVTDYEVFYEVTS